MIARRLLLGTTLVAGAAAVALPGRARAAPAAQRADQDDTVPETLAAAAPAGGVQDPGFPVGHLGVTWSGSGRGGAVRFRRRGGWGNWRPLRHGDAAGPDRGCALVAAGGALGYEVDPPSGAEAVRTVAINTTDGPRVRRVPGPHSRLLPLPGVEIGPRGVRYRSRASWGADESLRFGPDGAELLPTAYFPVQTLTVHHTVTANVDDDPAATVRAIYSFHTITQSFGDIGYHLLVDSGGTVYEGRWSGADPVPVFDVPRGGLPRMCTGAHVGGFNTGNVGVALLGDLTTSLPTAAARSTLVDVLAGLCGVTGLDPLARVSYVNPISGALADVDVVAGHRDWRPTGCPGDTFYPTLPGVRREVAALLGRGPTGSGVP